MALVLALGVGPLVDAAKAVWTMKRPEGAPRMDIGVSPVAPMWIGLLEVVLFYASMIGQAWSLAGGWLVFKAASTWAAWQHIIKVPTEVKPPTGASSDEWMVQWMEYRHAWGSKLLTSVLLGTLANIVVALAGYAIFLDFTNISFQPTASSGG